MLFLNCKQIFGQSFYSNTGGGEHLVKWSSLWPSPLQLFYFGDFDQM
mgnify:CR=1 FL=1